MREIVLDTETTGLDPNQGHRLVEIGCVELINHFPTGNTWHHYFNPEREMPEEAFKVHGLSNEFLADKPLFATLADEFLDYVGTSTLIIHNAPFDMKFLNFELQRIGRPPLPMEQVIDTLALARRKFPGGQNTLDALCRRFKIDNSNRTLHGALLDSELLAEVYIELIGARQAGLALDIAEPLERPQYARRQKPVLQRPKPLPSRISAAEQEAHAAFIASLGENAIWKHYQYDD